MFREFEVSDTSSSSDSAQYTKHQVGKDLGQVFYFLFYETGYAIYYTSNSLSSRLNLPVAGATCIYSTKQIEYSMPARYSNPIFFPS